MTHFLFLCKILLLGLTIAQLLSTVQVYVSNIDYYRFLTSIEEAGYLAVPNERVFSTFRDFGPAFCGGLFFTFTAGASLTLISSGLAWSWDRLFARSRIILFLLSVLLLLCLVSANIQGFSLLFTGYFLSIPALVFRFTLKWVPRQLKNQRHTRVLFPLLGFLLFALILLAWRSSVVIEDRLLDIRDCLLLSNSAGRRVNAFYYENSLYATRVFKSPRHELLRTCSLEGISDPSLGTRISEALLSRDYLPLGNTIRPDVRIVGSDKSLEFYDRNTLVLESSIEDFLRSPAGPLKQVERRTNKHAFVLGFTLFSMLFVGALFLYVCIYVPLYWLSGLFLKSTPPKEVKAGILWPLVLLAAFLAVNASQRENLSDPMCLSRSLTSDRLHTRIGALKHILRNKIDITRFPAYSNMVESRHIPERYWLAKALGVSETPESRRGLHQLLDDSHFNVVCMALDSLGRRGNRADIPAVLGRIEASDNWYVQWYAYRALRRLGWRQKRTDETMHRGDGGGSQVPSSDQFGQ